MHHCELAGADLTGADLTDSSWLGTDLPRARLRGVLADGSQWTGCLLDGADLTGFAAENWTVLDCSGNEVVLSGLPGPLRAPAELPLPGCRPRAMPTSTGQ